ncbi:MAG: DUF2283 domain-containing protein [Candidatus Scalindua sp.]
MKPIKIFYDEKGNTLYVRFRENKEAYCTESDIGKEIIFSRAEDGTVIGFEILNFFPKEAIEKIEELPIETKIIKAS